MRASVIAVTLVLLSSLIATPAAGSGMAACDILPTKCAGAAASTVEGCAVGSFHLGFFGARPFQVCAAVGVAVAAIMVFMIGGTGTVVAYGDAPGDPPEHDECSDSISPDLAMYWQSKVCDAAVTKCGSVVAQATASNALGALPTQSAGARHNCAGLVFGLIEDMTANIMTVPDEDVTPEQEAEIRESIRKTVLADFDLQTTLLTGSPEGEYLRSIMIQKAEEHVRTIDLNYFVAPL